MARVENFRFCMTVTSERETLLQGEQDQLLIFSILQSVAWLSNVSFTAHDSMYFDDSVFSFNWTSCTYNTKKDKTSIFLIMLVYNKGVET
jgi:hypothetical protein